MKETKTYRFKGNTLILRKTLQFKAKHLAFLSQMKRNAGVQVADWTTKTGNELINMGLAKSGFINGACGFILTEDGFNILKKLEAL